MNRKSPLVLVVDDDPDILDAICDILDAEGYAVARARHGGEALERVAERRPDLILLDLMMPVMDGWQFREAQVQNAELAKIPVVVVSAAGRDRLERIDADAYLSKPVDLEELLGCVSHFCQRAD